MRTWRLLALLAIVLMLPGCSSSAPTVVDSGTSYTAPSAQAKLAALSTAAYGSAAVADAPALRSKALTALRSKGQLGSQSADLITRTFPPDTKAVPVYIEKARFEGKPAILVVEAYGPEGGDLTHKRLWVLSSNGEVLFSAASK